MKNRTPWLIYTQRRVVQQPLSTANTNKLTGKHAMWRWQLDSLLTLVNVLWQAWQDRRPRREKQVRNNKSLDEVNQELLEARRNG